VIADAARLPSPSLELPGRVSRALSALAYTLLSVGLGVLGAVTLVAVGVGAALSLLTVGLPLLIGAVAACRWLAEVDRRLANRLLDAHLAPMPRRRRQGGSPWRQALDGLGERQLLRIAAVVTIKLPLAAVMLAVDLGLVILIVGLVVLGVRGIGGPEAPLFAGPLELGPLSGVLLLLLAVPAAVLSIAALEGMRAALRGLSRALLAPPQDTGGPVREMLAESLGDRTLSIAYWLPDREIFVDESGRAVALPEPDSGRAWTAVDRDGVRVAAIVHDAELEAGPDLVSAAAAAAALAIDNERLKADLRARVDELRVSRVRIVEAGDSARRRLERDLHDGAQQQLVSLALDLSILKGRLRDHDAVPVVDELSGKLAVALAELRELARGIHPVILTERGLGPAVEALANRGTIPVRCEVAFTERLPPPIEAAAYFVVAEALTNVARYAQAENAEVLISLEDGEVVVAVHDDGVGGATIDAGTGLRGLNDRLAALDGMLILHSPPGAGTHLEARIPRRIDELADAREPGHTLESQP